MQRPFFRSVIIGVALALTTLLSGCGAMRLAYNQAPDLGYWWLDKYIDFNDEQTPRVRDAIASWFRWNRSTQLPDYAQWLDKLSGTSRSAMRRSTTTTPTTTCSPIRRTA
jgi:hypothetical protein